MIGMKSINSIQELDEVIKQANTVNWNRLKGFYNRVRWGGAYDLIDHIETISSLYKALRKQDYTLSYVAVMELINLYSPEELEDNDHD